jgi:hypothetical protein
MRLEDIYRTWQFKPIVGVGASETPVKQSEGRVAVDFLPNTYQTEVRNRAPRDTVVVQASADDATRGTFNTNTAFKYYTTLVNSPLKTFKTKVVHLYNAQGTPNSKYVTSNLIRNTPGALYSTNS